MNRKEKWVAGLGWKRVKGFKINLDELRDLNDDWDWFYVSREALGDYVEPCVFWQHDNQEDQVFEDVDDLIGFIEEFSEERYVEK